MKKKENISLQILYAAMNPSYIFHYNCFDDNLHLDNKRRTGQLDYLGFYTARVEL